METLEALRNEVFGNKGFTAKLRKLVLSPQQLAQETQNRVLRDFESSITCENVNSVLCALLDGEYEAYLSLEQKAFEQIVPIALQSPEFPRIQQVVRESLQKLRDASLSDEERLAQVGSHLWILYKLVSESFAQSRKTRAGGSAQYHIAWILDKLGFEGEYETQRTLNGTVDFLFPSLEMWRRDRRRCTILSVKRSLRERYKQIYEELGITRGLTVYLLVTQTEEESQKDLTTDKVNNLDAQNVYLVVRDSIKRARFAETANVRGFTEFFCNDLPRLRTSWKG